MNSKIRTTYKWVAPILLIVFGAFLINNTKEIKMGWNPANWQITDILQGQKSSGGLLGNNLQSFGANTTGSALNTANRASAPSSPQVLGTSDPGFMYYDANSGGAVSSDNLNAAGNPIFDASGNRINYNAGTRTTNTPQRDTTYGQWGGKAGYDAEVGNINVGKTNALSSATASQDAGLREGRSSIFDFMDGARSKQLGIDQSRANAQFSLQEGKGDIMDMVGRGIRSGGVMLANKNASSSGAAGQIARAYGELGNREARDVGNQFALENQGIDLQQNELATGFETKKRQIDEFKIGQAEEISGVARNALAALEAQRVGASLPEMFQIDAEVNAIKQATMAKLGELDTLLQSERSKINPMGQQQTLARANTMRTDGTGGPQMFDFNTNTAQMQSGGPSIAGAEVPTYSNVALNRRREV